MNAFLSATTSNAGGSNVSTTVNWAVQFPNTRDFYKHTTNADLLQPGLGPLQPNLDDLDLDWLTSGMPSTSNRNGLEAAIVTKNSNDLLAAVVTATTASNNSSVNHNEQVQAQQQQPLMMVTASQFVQPQHQLQQPQQSLNALHPPQPPPQQPQLGKQRAMMSYQQEDLQLQPSPRKQARYDIPQVNPIKK